MRTLLINGLNGIAPFVPAKYRPMLPLIGALVGLLALGVVGAADDAGGCC